MPNFNESDIDKMVSQRTSRTLSGRPKVDPDAMIRSRPVQKPLLLQALLQEAKRNKAKSQQ